MKSFMQQTGFTWCEKKGAKVWFLCLLTRLYSTSAHLIREVYQAEKNHCLDSAQRLKQEEARSKWNKDGGS